MDLLIVHPSKYRFACFRIACRFAAKMPAVSIHMSASDVSSRMGDILKIHQTRTGKIVSS
jgi:hypothetical protein